eukprot:TRINITY_DN15356_c0_g1_i1.p1 TRINITY_DN15356_c0_g1~~TRINITY_DN15356_c0_g1_i1.p1  ORF type:complete len:316 (+),score=64.77 TRINITY_DN15356_c0_g1_i1:63-950(+)
MATHIDLSTMLNAEWLKVLGPVLSTHPQAAQYLGETRPKIFPKREWTFRALNALPPQQWKVVIFGQDPYPREESAIGISFCDGAIKKWENPLSPSFRNIIKNLFIFKKLMTASDKIDKFRAVCKSSGIPQPPEWFMGTRAQGVLWLNTSLTFSSTDKADLDRHTKFWRPIMHCMIEALLRAKSVTADGLVFVLWGGNAKALKKVVLELNKRFDVPVEFVEANHPAVETFHANNTFELIEAAQQKLGQVPIDWFKAGSLDDDTDMSVAGPADVSDEKRKVVANAEQSAAKRSKSKK